jgi:carbonic anhydrase
LCNFRTSTRGAGSAPGDFGLVVAERCLSGASSGPVGGPAGRASFSAGEPVLAPDLEFDVRGCYRHRAMAQIAQLLAANRGYAAARANVAAARPGRHIAVVTCMDARIDVFAALGLHLGDAHIIRNAGGRVTDDVLRSLALSTQVLGVDTVVVMQHTQCGLAGVTDEELRALTGADLGFFPIDDHAAALREDIETLSATPFLAPVRAIAGFIYDVQSGEVDDVVYWERPAVP